MNLEELGSFIRAERKDQQISFSDLRQKGVSYNTVKRIEAGENYVVSALFAYLEQLSFFLMVDGQIVEDIVAFGEYLRNKRIEANIPLCDISLYTQQVVAIEKGRHYYKDTLETYLKKVPVSFDVVFMMDALEGEYFKEDYK